MLGKTAGGLYWMFRSLERSENTSRLIDAGFRVALTRASSAEDEWASVLKSASAKQGYDYKYDTYEAANVIDFLLRDSDNPSSVMSIIDSARINARLVRTALTREVWEATNECWMTMKNLLARPVNERELPKVLDIIKQQGALVRGALHGTMLRNDIYDFARLGTFIERADNTARILDTKYHVLLPSVSYLGSPIDNIQWETVLRSVSGQRAYRWLYPSKVESVTIADFLMLDARMPRSFAFCYEHIADNLRYLEKDYGERHKCQELANDICDGLKDKAIEDVFDYGLHEFINNFISRNIELGNQIENDYQFYRTAQ